MIFGTLGGLGLFLFGMGLMSNGLREAAGQKLRNILSSLTRNRIAAAGVGAGVTCLVQSSSATTLMTLGFINAGLLTLKQALSVVLGSNVGTTFTAWLVSVFSIEGLKITIYALPAIGIGFFLQWLGRKQKIRNIGTILLGFGLLFVGISFMKDAFEPLEHSVKVQQLMIWLGKNPILAVLAGTVITVLLQSSSASIMMIQVLAFQGAFGADWDIALKVAIPFILGDNIGTTITAQLGALSGSRNSKRLAMGHTMFNVIGVAYILPIVWIGWYDKFVGWITPFKLTQNTIMVHIAVAHSLFNIFNTMVFLPKIQLLQKIVFKIIPITREEEDEKPVILEEHLLDTPTLAFEQAHQEIIRMSKKAHKAFTRAVNGLITGNTKKLASARRKEDSLDDFQYETTTYLSKLSERTLTDQLSSELPVLLHTVNDLEKIGDHCVNICEIADRKSSQKLSFTNDALKEINQMKNEADNMFKCVIQAISTNDIESAKQALIHENNINRMQKLFRQTHVERMSCNKCKPEIGLIFIDLVDNIEKIGDHLTNIAQSVAGGLQWVGIEQKITVK